MSLAETSDNEEEAPLSQESSMPIAPTGSEPRALANELEGTRGAHGMEFSQLEALAGADIERLTREQPRLAAEFYRRVGKALSQQLRRTSVALIEALG